MTTNKISQVQSPTIKDQSVAVPLQLWDETKVKLTSEDKMCLSANVVMLQETLARTPSGLPAQLVDPEAILNSSQIQQEGTLLGEVTVLPDNGTIFISYAEGFGTVDGVPLWERLPKETVDAYKLYLHYRDQKEHTGNRSFQAVGKQYGVNLLTIVTLSNMYHWMDRNLVFDSFREVLDDIRRERDVREMSSRHIRAARDIFKVCTNFIADPDNVKSLTHKTALSWAELAVNLERLSLGLHPDKPGWANGMPTSAQAPMIQINHNSNNHQNNNVSGNGKSDELSQMTDVLKILASSGALGRLKPEEAEIVEAEISGEIVPIKPLQ